jgi:hypothetical protein
MALHLLRPARNRRLRRHRIATIASALTLSLVASAAQFAGPARADEDPPYDPALDRETAAWYVLEGPSSVARAAAEALLGTDEQVRQFVETGAAEAYAKDERAAAQALAGMDGPSTRAAALRALDGPADQLTAFVDGGFKAAWVADERLRAYRVLEAGGPNTKAAAQKALAGTDEDVSDFLARGRRTAEYADDRLAVTRMLAGAANNSGPVMDAAAQRALAGTPEEIREFLTSGQYVARARDQELASVRSLTQQAKDAGEVASRESLAAAEASGRAVNKAEEAKKAAQVAAAESRAAGGAASKASAAAGRAADAAEGAADAAQDAVSASNAAMRAARVAADAARKATTAASLTAQAASRAQSAAAAARTDAGKAAAARQAAQAARDAAAKARELGQVKAERDRALAQARAAADAARSASGNADAAARAAGEAGSQAGVSAEQAQRARNAAARASRNAAAAARAADRALSLANAAAKASDDAFRFAAQAAQHAENAAAAAEDAAAHAGDAARAAAESARHAAAAVEAANLAVTAANQAVELEALARQEDEKRLAQATEQGIQAAQDALAQEQAQAVAAGDKVAWNQQLRWDTAEEDRVDADTRRLLTEATAAGAPADVARDRGRRAALALLKTGGQWTKEAARQALSGTDTALLAWLSTGRRAAVGQDDRARLWNVVDTLPDGPERTAAKAALDGDDAAVEQFLRNRSYPGKTANDRRTVYQMLTGAGPNVTAAAQRALSGTAADLHEFLRTGQYTARTADERLEVYRVMEAGGPEVQAAAQVALAGPGSYLTYFLTTSRYQAAQRDAEQASHVSAVRALIVSAQQYAQKAVADGAEAQRVAAVARNAANEAAAYARQAADASNRAADYATQAAQSAVAAKNSADQAAQSAVTARNAANSAQSSANNAAKSAAVATGAARRAAADAAGAREAAKSARAAATAAGKDAALAQQAADEAVRIYDEKLKAYQNARRSTEPGSGSDGDGTALQETMTWGCLVTELTKECLKVYVSFGDALMRPAKCDSTANQDSAGCLMLNDVREFIEENPELLLDMLQFVLMACGLAPGAGEVCDGIDAGVSFGRGDWVGGTLSSLSTIPILGWGTSALNGWRKADKFRDSMRIFEELAQKCDNVSFNSFLPGTPVLLADGRRKPIERVRVGDRVLAGDAEARRTAGKAVTATIAGAGVKRLVDITVDTDGDDGSATATVTATDHHPFWVPADRDWVDARNLEPGMSLQDAGGDRVEIERVRHRTRQARVYNLTVADLHTYFVLAGAVSLLVHNCGKVDLDHGVRGAHPKDHIGKTDEEIKNRARTDPRAPEASTLNAATAQATIDRVVAENRTAIDNWARTAQVSAERRFQYRFTDPVGRVADNQGNVADGYRVELVLKKIGAKSGTGHKGSWVLYTLKVYKN